MLDPHRERSVLPLAFLCALALFVASQYSLRWLPAYHDAALHWESAQLFFDRPWFPFVTEHDTGHPPLISWLLGALWHLPMSRLLAMHLLGWMAAALLCAALFDIGRRTKGLFFGLCLATLVGFHPVVLAQALQLNLDLFQVAFAWTAVAGMVAGRPWQVALALTATSLTKLNGPFSIPPLALWIGWRLLQEGSLGNARRVLAAVWPIAIPSGVFVLYHALKYRLTGHLLVSPEFQDDNLRFVGTVSEYFGRLRHALGQLLGFHNPNLMMLILTAILIVIFCVRLRGPGSVRTAWEQLQPGKSAHSDRRFFRPLLPQETLALSVLFASGHLLLWAVRRYFALVRYTMVIQPALALCLLMMAVLAFPQQWRRALWAVTVPMLLLFVLTSHPRRASFLPKAIAAQLAFPPTGIDTNHENNLELIDELDTARRALADIEQRLPPRVTIETRWPFNFFFTDPSLGMVKTPYRVVPTGGEVLFLPSASLHSTDPPPLTPRPGYQVSAIHRSERVLDVTFVRKFK